VPGMVRLDQAKITGFLTLGAATIGTPGETAQAVAADGLSVDGGVELRGLTASGLVSMEVAAISGSVDLTGARIANPGRRALSFSQAQIGGQLTARRVVVTGETRMHNCRVAASLGLQGSSLTNPQRRRSDHRRRCLLHRRLHRGRRGHADRGTAPRQPHPRGRNTQQSRRHRAEP
jgi:hypothetical protein